jgi:hypothetical protein
MPITPEAAAALIIQETPAACEELNRFTAEVFQTRGGRIGSGMGGVIEALWGFYLNRTLQRSGHTDIEIAWIYGHEYNDFACVNPAEEWNPSTRAGEILRIEAKSMVASADESKAHFDRLQAEFETGELLAVFLWDWVSVGPDTRKVFPRINDYFVGSAVGVAALRDALHLNRGGTFVQAGRCPDRCPAATCRHIGEPLNKSGTRERKTGPDESKGKNAANAANFGGLLRMLGTRSKEGRAIITHHRREDAAAAGFVDFMARNFTRVRRQLEDV